jgi:integrase
LSLFDNGSAKAFVAELNALNLAPSTINQVFNLVTAVIASAVDDNGNQKFPMKWNRDFIDLPIVSKADTDAPIVSPEQVQEAIRASEGQNKPLIALLAASGLRIGECLALGCHSGAGFSYWDRDSGSVWVKSTLVRGRVFPQPKTAAGIRCVDFHPDINEYLKSAGLPTEGFLFQNSRGNRVRIETAYDHLEDVGITEGFHAFRRFRATFLESQNVPRSLTSYWLGHSENSITARYIKIGQDLETRKEWARRAGYGFELPKDTK